MKLFRFKDDLTGLEVGDIVEIQPGVLIISEKKISDSVQGTVIVTAKNGNKEQLVDGLLDQLSKASNDEEKELYIKVLKLL